MTTDGHNTPLQEFYLEKFGDTEKDLGLGFDLYKKMRGSEPASVFKSPSAMEAKGWSSLADTTLETLGIQMWDYWTANGFQHFADIALSLDQIDLQILNSADASETLPVDYSYTLF